MLNLFIFLHLTSLLTLHWLEAPVKKIIYVLNFVHGKDFLLTNTTKNNAFRRTQLNRRKFLTACAAGLMIPQLSALAGSVEKTDDGFFILKAKKSETKFFGDNGPTTQVWSYNNTNPGPIIKVKQGEKVKVRLVNELDQATSIHWHGIRIDNKMDGVSGLTQDAVKPGESFDYEFTAPDAGTYWYHTHNRSWEQLARGLYGLLIVEEPDKSDVREINLVIDDWRLDNAGKIDEKSMGEMHDWAHGGRLGNVLTLNGKQKPKIKLNAGERVRLRIVNVANSRIMELKLADHDPWIIAKDGHPITPRKLKKDDLILGPAQRIDLMLDATHKPGTQSPIHFVDQQQKYEIASFEYSQDQTVAPITSPPKALAITMPHANFKPLTAKIVPLVMIGGAMGSMEKAIVGGKTLDWKQLVKAKRVWAFNGIAGDLDKPLVKVNRGETVQIDITNDTAFPHAMHLHGTHFKVVARNNMSFNNGEWRDTELVYPNEKVSFAFLADNPGRWLFHCHMIEHQAGGMVTWIDVV